MPKNGARLNPDGPATPSVPVPHQPGEMPAAGRLTVAQVLPTTVFPMIGSLLYIAGGMRITDVFTFLAGCGGIGAVVTISATGGRRLAMALAHGFLAAVNTK
ncbi:hypothetical protein ACFYRN_42545 [Streptomyces sp. NPDC005227]|uniref:hypothetical protein n=1 Tax=Streptomyces sp. NPDC005227 TaxID=3364707 RepID=UPI0036A496CD